MTNELYGSRSRRPVVYSGKRVAGLWERTLIDGSTVYDVSVRLGGARRRKRLDATTPTDAIAELRALQTDWARGVAPRAPGSGASVEDLAREWLVDLESRVGRLDSRQSRSKRTVSLYRSRLERFVIPVIGNVAVAEVNVSDVRRVVSNASALGLAPSTTSSVLSILSGLLRFAVKLGALERNPARDLDRDDRPGVKRLTEPRYLDVVEVEALLSKMTDTFRPVAATCAYAGLRVSEALGLVWGDVDLRAGTLTISRQLGAEGERVELKTTSSAATIQLLPALARELRELRSREASKSLDRVRPDALVFATTRGKAQSRRNALRALHAAGDATGLNEAGREKIGMHDLRHSFVSIALASNLTLPEASMLARHASPRVTAELYAGLSMDARAGATTKLALAGFGA